MSKRTASYPFCVTKPASFRLSSIDPGDTAGLKSKDKAADRLSKGVKRLSEWQDVLYAQDRWSVLLIFQAMDAAGKDSTIKHVMSGINPQGCQVYSFKSPSPEELDHDFLWRTTRCLPERGRIGIFNRSYYEETLVVRVHPDYLEKQRLPPACRPKDLETLWTHRFESINDFEKHLARNGTLVLKFFLHVSPGEQAERFLSRLEEPEKYWKFSAADLEERKRWKDYMKAYEAMIRATSTEHGRWHVVPADHKWFARLVVAETIVAALERLDLRYPEVDEARIKEIKRLRNELRAELSR